MKAYIINYDGNNLRKVVAKNKKEACKFLGVTENDFKNYGNIDDSEEYYSYGVVFEKPILALHIQWRRLD